MARQCKGTTRKGGACGAPPLKPGTLIDDVAVSGNWCRQHDEDLPASARIGGAQPGGGRPKQPTATEAYAAELHRRVGEHIDQLVGRLVDIALDAERTVVVGTGPNARTEIAPDQGLQLAALRELNDRILGRPKQQTEVTGAGGGPVELVEIPNTAEYRARVAALAASALGVGVDDR